MCPLVAENYPNRFTLFYDTRARENRTNESFIYSIPTCLQNYSYSIIAAIAAVISCISVTLSLPRLLIKRLTSTPRICSVSMAETFVSPLVRLGSIRMCQMFRENCACQPVIGATSLIGRRPIASELITTAGRIFRISEPIVGSKFISQTSPRRGLGGFVFNKISPFKFTPFRIVLIVIGHLFRLFP